MARNRTKKGNVTAKARKRYGTRGKFPVFDQKSALSAIRLRGHGNKKKILNKVARWAAAHKNSKVKAAVKRARARDRRKS